MSALIDRLALALLVVVLPAMADDQPSSDPTTTDLTVTTSESGEQGKTSTEAGYEPSRDTAASTSKTPEAAPTETAPAVAATPTPATAVNPKLGKPAFSLNFLCLSKTPGFTVEKVELTLKKKKVSKWVLSGTCKDDTSVVWSGAATIACKEEKWTAELPHQAKNVVLSSDTVKESTHNPSQWLAYWTPSDKTENVTTEKLDPTSLSIAFLDGQPVTTLDLDSGSRESAVIRNFSPALDTAEKVQFFVSSGDDNYVVNTQLDKAQYSEVPWQVWGAPITKKGNYAYSTTLWKDQKDTLGTAGHIEFTLDETQHWRLKTFSAGILGGYQFSAHTGVASLDLRWLPRYQLSGRIGLRGEVGLPILKQSGGKIFPAFDMVVGAGYNFEDLELQLGVGWQRWFATGAANGFTLTAGGFFPIGPNLKGWLLGADGLQGTYKVMFIAQPVHFLVGSIQWTL